jgi:hypothetical protein
VKHAVALVALTLALSACAGAGATGRIAGSTPPGSSSPRASAATATSGGTLHSPAPPTSSRANPKGARGDTSPTPVPLGTSAGGRVKLALTCVHRGEPTEQQVLTVTAGPGETVGYSTFYSDYSSELNRPDYTTGHGYGVAGPDHMFHASWIVPAGATLGRATVQVIATDMDGSQSASYFVVAQGKPCP